MSIQQTATELETGLGEQVRAERLRSNTSVADVALRAGLSINAVRRLERGDGATVATLARVLRALGREAWLGSLQPAITVSPLQMLRSTQPRQRSSAGRIKQRPAGEWIYQHLMAVNGKFSQITRADFKAVAERFDLLAHWAGVLEQVQAAVAHWPHYAAQAGVDAPSSQTIAQQIKELAVSPINTSVSSY